MKRCVYCGKYSGIDSDWCSDCIAKVRKGRGIKFLSALSAKEKASLAEACKLEKKKKDELRQKEYEEYLKSIVADEKKQKSAEPVKPSSEKPVFSDEASSGGASEAISSVKVMPEAYVFHSPSEEMSHNELKTDAEIPESEHNSPEDKANAGAFSDEELEKILLDRGLTLGDLNAIVDSVLEEEASSDSSSNTAEDYREPIGSSVSETRGNRGIRPWIVVLISVLVISGLINLCVSVPGALTWILGIGIGLLCLAVLVFIILVIID